MARVTVEDCLGSVANRFELVLTASKRARQIANGAEPFVAWENDKPTVVALREIAEGHVGPQILEAVDEEPAFEIEQEQMAAEGEQPPEEGGEARPEA